MKQKQMYRQREQIYDCQGQGVVGGGRDGFGINKCQLVCVCVCVCVFITESLTTLCQKLK